jgi:hypothetical protein
MMGYHVPKGAYASLLPQVVKSLKDTIREEGAFEEEKIIATENAMAGIARLCYKQMDGTTLTEEDLVGVFSKMPFTEEETEAQNSHQLLLNEFARADSIVHSANVKPASTAVI